MYLACIYTDCVACSWSQSVLGYSSTDTLVGTIHLACTGKSLLPHYHAWLVALYTHMMGCKRSLRNILYHVDAYLDKQSTLLKCQELDSALCKRVTWEKISEHVISRHINLLLIVSDSTGREGVKSDHIF